MIDEDIANGLRARAESGDTSVLRGSEFRSLVDELKTLPDDQRADYGRELNALKQDLQRIIDEQNDANTDLAPIDVTAPWDINTPISDRPAMMPATSGSVHPLMKELDNILQIYARMGFAATESRQIDDDWHMFSSLNFPEDHPARDDYDTFLTEEKDKKGKLFVAPAHTSTMQNRILKNNAHLLEEGQPIAHVIPGRVFRNEDLDARHEHTFYQLEGVYVDKGIQAGHLMAVLQTFFENYYGNKMEIKTQPFYFPFTEPSFEFAIACLFCNKAGCNICGEGWLELLGCGMIHPNVLKMADIDPEIYSGFAWGGGIERLVMIKHAIEDVRFFHSARLDFLRQFK